MLKMASAGSPKHPYLPTDLDIPNYLPNDKTALEILLVFFGIVGALFVFTWWLAGRRQHTSPVLTRAKLCWFAACAFIHLVVEGYFSLYHKTFPEENSFLAQVCKYET